MLAKGVFFRFRLKKLPEKMLVLLRDCVQCVFGAASEKGCKIIAGIGNTGKGYACRTVQQMLEEENCFLQKDTPDACVRYVL